jgi:hypothetical protein
MQNPNAKGHTMIIGYCRVSTDGQTLDAQLAELKGKITIQSSASPKMSILK